jgi:hypothetical protein
MRLFTIIGVILLVAGIALAVFAFLPGGGGIWDEARTQGGAIAAISLIPTGLIFTAIGVYFGRMTARRKRLLREGIAGQATILSLSGGNLVINNVNYMITFRLRVSVPGRSPYDVEHKQLVPVFQLASLPVGSTVPVMVDPQEPTRLTIDFAGEAVVLRQADARAGGVPPAQPVPNTLSTMQAAPNTFTSDPNPGPVTAWPAAATAPAATAGAIGGLAGSIGGLTGQQLDAVTAQLARFGVSIDPAVMAQGAVVVDQGTSVLDASPSGQAGAAALLASGRPGSAFIREAKDTGIDVHGDSVIELTLDVTPQGGTPYEVRTAALVPAASRARALPGTTVPVRIDPAQATNVAVDWAG